MSAYGTVAAPSRVSNGPLTPLLYRLPNDSQNLAVVHVTRSTIPRELAEHLCSLFNEIVEAGRTYPQENRHSQEDFDNYFLAYDLFLGILVPNQLLDADEDVKELEHDFFASFQKQQMATTSWRDVTAGCYYVKPNYPGRSSHCCNAGFIVDTKHRGLKLGKTLGRSYLVNAPKLGYKYSVFNLVYVSNIPSIKIWDSLGFQRAGLIPKAGRLRVADGSDEEEYVDAIVFWRDFSAPLV